MALCFASASSQFAEIAAAYTDLLASTTNVTFSVWFRTTNLGSQPFLWSTKGAGTGRSFLEHSTLTGFFFGTNGTFITSTGVTIQNNTWTHLVATRSSVTGNGSIWVNGVLFFEATLPAHAAGPGDLYLGRFDSGLYLDGKLYDFRIWSSVLIKANIRKAWAGQSVPTTLVASWLLNESSGTTFADSAGSHPGSLFGATWDADAPVYGELDAGGGGVQIARGMAGGMRS